MNFNFPKLPQEDYRNVPSQLVDSTMRVGKGFMADKPGTYTSGPESMGEAMAFAPTPLMAGSMGLKMGGKAAGAFGRALQGARKYIPMHSEDIADVSPALERYLTQDDINYYLGQRGMDENLIKTLAGHYIGRDILSMHKDNPRNIAQELLNRVILDRSSIPKL